MNHNWMLTVHAGATQAAPLQEDAILSAEEYQALATAAETSECPQCGNDFIFSQGVDGPPDVLQRTRYCTASCIAKMERTLAPMIRPQPRSLTTDPALIGWI